MSLRTKSRRTYRFEVPATVVVSVEARSLEEAKKLAKDRVSGGAFLGKLSDGSTVLAVEHAGVYLQSVSDRRS